ncbi:MAG: hypothetical protein KF727_14480 [Microbacteriaceae bacterium]|nr:hypothetical protein [Microbacteriaceae bacterium]
MSDAAIRAEDPVTVYDVMREARTRLAAAYSAREGDDGLVVEFVRALNGEVEAVAFDDIDAQRALAADFDRRRAALG